ncbi:MAG: hypothetical protein GPJ50_10085, partial [Candidatus Heimdallarchaeota archaeon]|nr:hypothetical protein [Candidatus Heimdallarchaeota archaeon]
MKRPKFFSFIGFSFKSMYSNRRRSISIGAGMILGAAIFSSIFFYGSIINTITVQDMIENVEAEITFRPLIETNLVGTLPELADLLSQEMEFEDCIVTYGRRFRYDITDRENRYHSYFTPDFNFSEYAGFKVEQPSFEPLIVDSSSLNHSIVEKINVVA